MSSSIHTLVKILKEAVTQEDSTPTGTVWSIVLGTGSNAFEIYAGLSKFIWLSEEVRKDLSSMPIELNMDWLNDCEVRLFQSNLNEPWQNDKYAYKATLSQAVNISSLLRYTFPEPDVDHNQLEQFRDEIESLLNEVLASNIDKDLKDFFRVHLSEILDAIQNFMISGVKGLKEAVQKTLAEVAMNEPLREKVNSSSFGKRLWNLIGGISTVLSLVTGAVALPDIIQKALPLSHLSLLMKIPTILKIDLTFKTPCQFTKRMKMMSLNHPRKRVIPNPYGSDA
jgi:hypothetical protein